MIAGNNQRLGHFAHKLDIHADLLLVLALDREGYAVAAGSACAAGDAEPSHVLTAQGMSAQDSRSVVRISLGLATTTDEVDAFASSFIACADRLRAGGLEGIAAAI